MTDIVERLRASIRDLASGDWGTPKGLLIAEAACEIERLHTEYTATLVRLRTVVSLLSSSGAELLAAARNALEEE